MTQADTVLSTPRTIASKIAIVRFPKSKRPLPADRPSAIASVKRSGLKLIQDVDTPKGEPATHEQLAAMEFEPWAGKSEGTDVLTGENWMQQRISVVFAHATMFMIPDAKLTLRTRDGAALDSWRRSHLFMELSEFANATTKPIFLLPADLPPNFFAQTDNGAYTLATIKLADLLATPAPSRPAARNLPG
jgi:hypothetical protein